MLVVDLCTKSVEKLERPSFTNSKSPERLLSRSLDLDLQSREDFQTICVRNNNKWISNKLEKKPNNEWKNALSCWKSTCDSSYDRNENRKFIMVSFSSRARIYSHEIDPRMQRIVCCSIYIRIFWLSAHRSHL